MGMTLFANLDGLRCMRSPHQVGHGISIRCKKLERWKILSMVQRYAHHNPDSLRPSVARLDHTLEN
jgi:hypothetical protein